MKELNQDELALWTKGGNIAEKTYFVIIKTPNCVRCENLMKNQSVFGKMIDNIATFVFKPGPGVSIAAEIFSNLGLTSAPALIYHYQDDEKKWRLGEIDTDDIDDLGCIFDAINDNDHSFFGYSEYDDPIEEVPNYNMNRLLRLIYGEMDAGIAKEREMLKKEV